MARKNIDGFWLLIMISILAIFSVFLINTYMVNSHFSKKYNVKEAGIRVSDTGNILRFSAVLLGFAFFAFIIVFYLAQPLILILKDSGSHFMVYLLLALIAFIIFAVAMAISARLGTTQIGMIIDKDNDIFIIPTDYNKNSFVENIFEGKIFTSMFAMEELPLSGIRKITRESGKKAFIHGTFGTRCIKWRNKQKRDECIAALEMAKGKRMSSLDAGY